jgi:outer membrane protein assembly factor BamD
VLRKSLSRPAVLAAVAAALVVTGCAGTKKSKGPNLSYQERPVELLYATGADRLDKRQWNDAVGYFQEVERQHPYSEWSRRAILMTAYAHYEANAYAEAIGDAERFISLYPGNPSTAYAFYLKAICYFEQIVDVGRDQAYTELALSSLRDVVQRYPNSEYAQDARLKIDMVNDQLAGKEMTIGRFYLREGQTLAAVGRFRAVIDRYQTTSHTPEALYRLVEAYLTLGLLDEAKRNGAVLGYNYAGDRWYYDAYKLLTDANLKPAIEPTAKGAKRSYLQRALGLSKGTALPPPANDEAAAASAAPASATPAAAPAQKPQRKGFLHRMLRL